MPNSNKYLVNQDFNGAIQLNSIINPPIISVDQNNYSPTGLSNASVIRIQCSSNIKLTGLLAMPSGSFLTVLNVGTTIITLMDANVNSLSSNRFQINGNKLIDGNEGVIFWYDTVSLRWRIVGKAI